MHLLYSWIWWILSIIPYTLAFSLWLSTRAIEGAIAFGLSLGYREVRRRMKTARRVGVSA